MESLFIAGQESILLKQTNGYETLMYYAHSEFLYFFNFFYYVESCVVWWKADDRTTIYLWQLYSCSFRKGIPSVVCKHYSCTPNILSAKTGEVSIIYAPLCPCSFFSCTSQLNILSFCVLHSCTNYVYHQTFYAIK